MKIKYGWQVAKHTKCFYLNIDKQIIEEKAFMHAHAVYSEQEVNLSVHSIKKGEKPIA